MAAILWRKLFQRDVMSTVLFKFIYAWCHFIVKFVVIMVIVRFFCRYYLRSYSDLYRGMCQSLNIGLPASKVKLAILFIKFLFQKGVSHVAIYIMYMYLEL